MEVFGWAVKGVVLESHVSRANNQECIIMVENKERLDAKDLISIGVFSAVIVVLIFVGGVFFAINPALTFWTPAACALLPGPVFLLLVAKVRKRGVIAICGLVVGLVMFVTGMFWGIAVSYVVLGAVGDVIAGSGKYRSLSRNAVAYILFSLSFCTSYIVFFMNRSYWLSSMMEKTVDGAYFELMIAAAREWVLPAMIVVTILSALLSVLVGRRLLTRQFKKAGIVF
ncbi:MptD family putative ECF transporter S component [Prosthecochloris sp. SCSIO W1101]|uniref:MptD family putative ECF transporter S component n=1 Tax=Prosthecochloris sp. SCSIO W1101 TaxID=2992242 RepID=UPI00223D4E7F|nr:MptD family putative ECF transporter S component [Prosthecochloris sp. SCSIO W1101]UZJ40540.1 MptD family putative ECF transporter S component [Prosthecochloris sp. SCSIO W1101]